MRFFLVFLFLTGLAGCDWGRDIHSFSPKVVVENRMVSFQSLDIEMDGGVVSIEDSLVLERPGSGSAVVENVPLVFASPNSPWAINKNPWLGKRNISNLVVTKADDLTPLIEGEDYFVDWVNGKLLGINKESNILVNASFDFDKERYDLIQIDPITLKFRVLSGKERDIDASEFIPVPLGRYQTLFHAYVVGDKVTLIPTYRFKDRVLVGGEEEHQELMSINRAALSRVISRLESGEGITLVGYGDSITALGGGRGEYTPNGINRDSGSAFEAIQRDVKLGWEFLDYGDGQGPVHVHKGFNWHLKSLLEDQYSVTVEYLNFGGSSTHSGRGEQHGLWPDRIQPVLESGADLMVLAFGMNELGSDSTYENISQIIDQSKRVGMDVIVMAVPRPNASRGEKIERAWEKTNYQLKEAAMSNGAAFCATNLLTEGVGGGIPLAPESLAASNLFNHPGPLEHKIYGAELHRIFSKQ